MPAERDWSSEPGTGESLYMSEGRWKIVRMPFGDS